MALDLDRIWTDTADRARNNEYDGECVTCSKRLDSHEGRLVSIPNKLGYPPKANGVIHYDCPLPPCWHYRARRLHQRTLAELGINPVLTAEQPTELQGSSVDPLPTPAREPTEQELQAAVESIIKRTTDGFLEAVPPLVRATLTELTRTVDIKVGAAPKVTVKNSHKLLPDVVMCIAAGTDPFLVGPAGSGKTTLCQQACQVLKRKFYAESSVTSIYTLLGYKNAHGDYVRTSFREAFEKGGGFLLDECDNSDPSVLTMLNMAVANRICAFPDKMVEAHKDFFAIAAGNTYGRGADREYVGRNQLDAATLDRFVFIDIDYDEVAELSWAMNDDWTLYVQQIRAAVRKEHVRHVVSPRASIFGARLLKAGMERHLVEERCIWKGLDEPNRARILAAVNR